MKDQKVRVITAIDKTAHKIIVPKGFFCSDTFVCTNCGNRGIYKVLGNTKTCSECGGTMVRQ